MTTIRKFTMYLLAIFTVLSISTTVKVSAIIKSPLDELAAVEAQLRAEADQFRREKFANIARLVGEEQKAAILNLEKESTAFKQQLMKDFQQKGEEILQKSNQKKTEKSHTGLIIAGFCVGAVIIGGLCYYCYYYLPAQEAAALAEFEANLESQLHPITN